MVVKCAKRERKVNVVGLELERPSVLRVLMVESIVRSSPSQPAIAKQQKSQSRGSNLGSNLPVLWRPISGLNGAESTVNLKVNSRMCQKSKCHMWCRLRENGSHFSSSSCTQSCTQDSKSSPTSSRLTIVGRLSQRASNSRLSLRRGERVAGKTSWGAS